MPCSLIYIISYKRDPVSINVLSNAEVEYESHKWHTTPLVFSTFLLRKSPTSADKIYSFVSVLVYTNLMKLWGRSSWYWWCKTMWVQMWQRWGTKSGTSSASGTGSTQPDWEPTEPPAPDTGKPPAKTKRFTAPQVEPSLGWRRPSSSTRVEPPVARRPSGSCMSTASTATSPPTATRAR